MKAVVLLGAPGAGKGTVAEDIKKETGYIHVSTGEMLRQAVKLHRPVGLEAEACVEKGQLVPDEIIMRMVTERLDMGATDAKYMFDGFPRTTNQAVLLDEVFAQRNSKINRVFLLEVPRDVLIKRISGRRVCRQCGSVYHVHNIPPKVTRVCDQCAGELYQRPDDNEETVLNRLDVYQKQTASLIDYYRDKGILTSINAVDRYETEEQIKRHLLVPQT